METSQSPQENDNEADVSDFFAIQTAKMRKRS